MATLPSVVGLPASLSARQRELLERWLPGLRIVSDHSWGLVDNIVMQVESYEPSPAGQPAVRRWIDFQVR